MIKKTLEDAINEQINAEFYSAYLYLAMAAYFEDTDLPGFSNWMRIQYQEEISHVMKFFNYLNERGGRVILKDVKASSSHWDSPLNAFEDTLKHEEHVTSLINDLVDLAIKERDHATNNFLQWYIEEQVEEEAHVSNIISQVKLVQSSNDSLYMLDKELGQRVFVDPTAPKV